MEAWVFRFTPARTSRAHVAGLDFNTGSFSHSIRFGYLKAELDLRDATRGSGLPFSNYRLQIQMGNTGMESGPNHSKKRKYLNQTVHGGLRDAQSHLNKMPGERDRDRNLD